LIVLGLPWASCSKQGNVTINDQWNVTILSGKIGVFTRITERRAWDERAVCLLEATCLVAVVRPGLPGWLYLDYDNDTIFG